MNLVEEIRKGFFTINSMSTPKISINMLITSRASPAKLSRFWREELAWFKLCRYDGDIYMYCTSHSCLCEG